MDMVSNPSVGLFRSFVFGFGLLVCLMAASASTAQSIAGSWTLDTTRSELSADLRVYTRLGQSLTVDVTGDIVNVATRTTGIPSEAILGVIQPRIFGAAVQGVALPPILPLVPPSPPAITAPTLEVAVTPSSSRESVSVQRLNANGSPIGFYFSDIIGPTTTGLRTTVRVGSRGLNVTEEMPDGSTVTHQWMTSADGELLTIVSLQMSGRYQKVDYLVRVFVRQD
jgi:hypothetical protein